MLNTRASTVLYWVIAALGAGLLGLPPAFANESTPPGASCPALLQHQFPRLQDDAKQDLCQYAGKVLLIVNTASYCGFTNQYEGLEALQSRYQSKGLVVLGFPSNNFGQQEPGSSKQIADFCYNTYGVRFPMFAKSDVVGSKSNALFAALTKATGKAPEWNFHKYLVDRKGRAVASFPSALEPNSPELKTALERALAP